MRRLALLLPLVLLAACSSAPPEEVKASSQLAAVKEYLKSEGVDPTAAESAGAASRGAPSVPPLKGYPAYTKATDLVSKAATTVRLVNCSDATRDASGVMFIECTNVDQDLVRFSVFEEGNSDIDLLLDNGWAADYGPTWSVAASTQASTQESLAKVLAVLK